MTPKDKKEIARRKKLSEEEILKLVAPKEVYVGVGYTGNFFHYPSTTKPEIVIHTKVTEVLRQQKAGALVAVYHFAGYKKVPGKLEEVK